MLHGTDTMALCVMRAFPVICSLVAAQHCLLEILHAESIPPCSSGSKRLHMGPILQASHDAEQRHALQQRHADALSEQLEQAHAQASSVVIINALTMFTASCSVLRSWP